MSIFARCFTISACALCLALAALPAQAQDPSQPPAGASSKSKTKKPRATHAKVSPKVTYANGQTPAERQRSEAERLRRECRGRPNAGACLGYAN